MTWAGEEVFKSAEPTQGLLQPRPAYLDDILRAKLALSQPSIKTKTVSETGCQGQSSPGWRRSLTLFLSSPVESFPRRKAQQPLRASTCAAGTMKSELGQRVPSAVFILSFSSRPHK